MDEPSTRAFAPISEAGFYHSTLRCVAPIAVRRERGVDLSRYYKSELQAYVDAGPREGTNAHQVRKQIFERRGGVLPQNWIVVEHLKDNLDLMAGMRV